MSATTRDGLQDAVTVTVLVDNEAGDGLTAEHGLALWIEAAGQRILFDTGQGGALVPNARKLGVALETTDVIILSHGHYDHTDGLPAALDLGPGARVVMHPESLVTRYSIKSSGPARAVGVSAATRAAIERVPAERITWSAQPLVVTPNVAVTGTIARRSEFEDVDGPFYLDERRERPDLIVDDQALWVNTAEGLIVCVGCSHAGLINTLNAVREAAGTSRIRAIIGGFHLLNARGPRLEQTFAALQLMSPELLVPGHCTGRKAVDGLRRAFGSRVSACRCGIRFQFSFD